jgi:hypothetical protein
MEAKRPAQTQRPRASQEQPASTFPYGLGFDISLQNDHDDPSHANGASDSIAYVTKPEKEYEMVETFLRFPLTKCHHLIPFNMPETLLDASSDNVLPCGCWTGKAPDAQLQEASLFVDCIGADRSFKSVWGVTGLGADGCWECGTLEFEVGDGSNAEGGAVENGNGHGNRAWGYRVDGGIHRVNKETGEAMSFNEAFQADCEQWRKMEDWKDKWWNGDVAERGAKLMAESRWAHVED